MKDSARHASLHPKVCTLRNCDPAKCFGGPIGNVSAPVAKTLELTSPGSVTVVRAPSQARRVIEPGPPDPVPIRTVAADVPPRPVPDLNGSPSRMDLTPTCSTVPTAHPKLVSAIKGPTTPKSNVNASSVIDRTLVEPGPPDFIPLGSLLTVSNQRHLAWISLSTTSPRFYPIQDNVPSNYRAYDPFHGVIYNNNGDGWCMRCHGPWSEMYRHHCPSRAWKGTKDVTLVRTIQASSTVTLALGSLPASCSDVQPQPVKNAENTASPSSKALATATPPATTSQAQGTRKPGKRAKQKNKRHTGSGAVKSASRVD